MNLSKTLGGQLDICACVLQCATYIGNNQVQQWVDIICAAGQSLVRGGGYQGGHEGCGSRLRPMALCTLSLCTYSLCICVSVWNAWCAGVWVSGLVEGTHEGRDGLVTHAAHPPLHVRPPWFSKVFGGRELRYILLTIHFELCLNLWYMILKTDAHLAADMGLWNKRQIILTWKDN